MGHSDRAACNLMPADHNADWGRIVAVTRVVHLWTIRQNSEHIALGSQIDKVAWDRSIGCHTCAAIGFNGHLHEEINVADDGKAVEAVAFELLEEVCIATVGPVNAVTQPIVSFAAAAVDSIVLPQRIFDDSEQGHSTVGIEHRATADVNAALNFDGVHRAVSIGEIGGVVAEKINCLLPFEVNDP